MKKKHFAYLVFIAFISFSGKPLDEEVKKHPILGPLIEALDKYKMDAHSNWKGKGPANITRTTIAPLTEDYPIAIELKSTGAESFELLESASEKEFRIGALGAIVANEKLPSNKNLTFYEQWGKEKGKRIFISFASEDYKHAHNFRKLLRKNGYIAFVYLNSTGEVRYSPKKAGEFFQTADHVLIIDTKTARKKRGVMLETRLIKELNAGRLQTQKEEYLKKIEELEKKKPRPGKRTPAEVRRINKERAEQVELQKKVRRIDHLQKRKAIK